ncbi:MAG: diaminopimelate decarboxylase, partial [Nitratireductor sp.]|nr:diaminopimelate decarboxylase [Nitratireductor sp.]
TGIRLRYLDVGGGLGIDYEQHNAPAIADWATAVTAPILEAGYDVVLEPGRSIIGPTGALLTQVVYTKNQGDKHFTIVDAGMNDLIRPTLYEAHHEIYPVVQTAATSSRMTADVVGPVCETGDFLAQDREMVRVGTGDLLAVSSAGAYGAVQASTYNSRLLVPEVLVHGGRFHVIRPRQSYEELIALDSV